MFWFTKQRNKKARNTLICLWGENFGFSGQIQGRFRPFPACFGRISRRPIWPDFGQISPVWRESKPSQRKSEKKKKKTQTRHRRTGNHVGLKCGTLPAASMLSRSYHCWSPERTIQRPHTQWTFFITFQRGRRKNAKLQIVFISILTKHH